MKKVNKNYQAIYPDASNKMINFPQTGYFTCPLSENLVVVRKQTGHIFILNGTARFVWEDISNGCNPDISALNLSERFGISQEVSSRDVKNLLTDWRQRGLLPPNGAESKTPIKNEPDIIEKDTITPKPDKNWTPFSEYVYSMMGVSFRIRFGSQALEDQAHPRLSGHVTQSAQADSVIDVLAPGGARVVLRDGYQVGAPTDDSEMRSYLFGEIISIIHPGHKPLIYLHSAAVGMGGRCVVLPAKGGAGKSTLTTALVHHQLDYFSDDIVPLINVPLTNVPLANVPLTNVPLAKDSLLALPVPFGVCIKEKSWPAAERYFPQIKTGSDHTHISGKKARYLNIRQLTGRPDPAPAPVAAIVFPQYAPGAGTQLTPITPTKAFERIASLENGVPRQSEAIHTIIRWIESTPAYSLNFDSLEKAAETIKGLLAK